MTLAPGDRIRIEQTGDDGLPLVRYGFVGALQTHGQSVTVMLDGDLGAKSVDRCAIRPVTVTSVELCLSGSDLIDEPALRRGLAEMWHAEADSAGLDVDELLPLGDGMRDTTDSWALAELTAGGEEYVVRAFQLPHEPEVVHVRADYRARWSV